jgi:hypothetical protein
MLFDNQFVVLQWSVAERSARRRGHRQENRGALHDFVKAHEVVVAAGCRGAHA